jgi:sigma54-dependent transcription regulator
LRILLTFTGFNDPYTIGLVGEEQQPGPILSLLRARSFDRIVLFSTPNTANNTAETDRAIKAESHGVAVVIRELPLSDPSDYKTILKGLRTEFQDIADSAAQAEYFIATASGTPQMHACWVLLAASVRSLLASSTSAHLAL